jgi:membrane-bound lytic murein transglycosylase F
VNIDYKNIDYKRLAPFIIIGIIVVLFYYFSFKKSNSTPSILEKPIDLTQIRERGTLRVITEYNSISYFIYKNQTLGFDYEIIRQFAKENNLKVEFVIAKNTNELYTLLEQGKGDIIANGVHKIKNNNISYSIPYRNIEQVLVQRKSGKYQRQQDSTVVYTQAIQHLQQLDQKSIFLTVNSPYYHNIKKAADTLGIAVAINLLGDDRSTEDLINAVSDAAIDYTIADKDLAQINQSFLHNLDVSLVIGSHQDLHYAVRKKSPELHIALNQWLSKFITGKTYKLLNDKYFKQNKNSIELFSEAQLLLDGQISIYDNIIQHYAKTIEWDWRLIAALMYQESKFNTQATSWAGAKGLMQLMPGTARQMGLEGNPYQPDINIKAGSKYLKYLEQFWKHIPDITQRTKFILASYNAGPGHVQDAARLAKKYGYSDTEWDGNTEYFILYKSNPKFYTDKVVKYGYCRGTETFNYVRKIIDKYFYYTKNINDSTNNYLAIQQKDVIPFNGIDGVYNPTVELQAKDARQELFVSRKLFEQQQNLVPKNVKENPFDEGNNDLFKHTEKEDRKLFQKSNTLFSRDSVSSSTLIENNQNQINQLKPR